MALWLEEKQQVSREADLHRTYLTEWAEGGNEGYEGKKNNG